MPCRRRALSFTISSLHCCEPLCSLPFVLASPASLFFLHIFIAIMSSDCEGISQAAPAGDGSAAVAAFDEPTRLWTAAAPLPAPGPQRALASSARFGFSFSLPALPRSVDPTAEMKCRLESVTTLEELEVIVHPPDLFTGYSNKEEIYTTVKRRLT